MSDKVQRVPASALARLLNVVESGIDQLAKDGIIPKPVQGKFELVNSVRGYINHLRQQSSKMIDQAAVARHLDMSDRNLRDVLRGLGMEWPSDIDDIRVAYIRDLREKAAGRGGDDMAELTRMRIRESKAKAISGEIDNYEKLGLLVSVEEIEPALEQWSVVARSEVGNALNKIIGDIEGQYKIEVDRELLVDGHINAAYRIIGNHPGRTGGGRIHHAGEDAAAGGPEVDPAGEPSDAGMVA